jgi:hypothetical protein
MTLVLVLTDIVPASINFAMDELDTYTSTPDFYRLSHSS